MQKTQETQIQAPRQDNPPGEGDSSCILAWGIPWAEEPGWLQSIGVAKSETKLSTQARNLGIN